MQEYGGYIELDSYSQQEYHRNAIALNCGRNCLVYLIQIKHIKKLRVPCFLCSSVWNVCKQQDVTIKYYHINGLLEPELPEKLDANEWLYIVNYYGQLSDEFVQKMKKRYGNIIVDNAQDFFGMPADGVDTLYTCRKFFGVSDGAYLYTDAPEIQLKTDISFERMHYLLGRFEKSASEFYREYVENNHSFADEPVKAMSKLTHNLLRGIDYERVQRIRTDNFSYLHNEFSEINKLSLQIPEGAFMYPLWIENGASIRKELQKKKIYIPTLWPDVFNVCSEDTLDFKMAKDILPLPIDQRYTLGDMEYIVQEVRRCIG